MRSKLTALATAGVLSLGAIAPALAGSVTQPGETIGFAAGAPLPPGIYFANTADWGSRDRDRELGDVALGVDIPLLVWSTPWTILGGRLQLLAASPVVESGVSQNRFHDASYTAGWYNPLAFAQLAWDLGGGWGVSYGIGVYFNVDTGTAFDSDSLNQRFAVSYTANGWNITANVIYGTHFDSVSDDAQLSPCPDGSGRGCNPDFLNLDLTFTKTWGKWEFGPVAFGSWDLNSPIDDYQQQRQFAVGGLVGYDFGGLVKLQAYVTTDVTQHNYGGYDTRGWTRVIIPLSKLQ